MTRRQRVAVVVVAVVAVAATLAGGVVRNLPVLGGLALALAGLLFVVAGIVADARRPDTVIGRLLAAVGLSWSLSAALTNAPNRFLFTLGLVLFPLGLAGLGHLALVFPSGRASSSLERLLVRVPYGMALLGLPVIDAGECPECPGNLVGIAIGRGFGRAYYSGLLVAVLITTVAVLVVLVRRWSAASPVARKVLLPVLPGACVFAAAYVGGLLAELGLPSGLGDRWAVLVYGLLAVAPFVLLGGLLRARLARANVGGLVVELGDSSPSGSLRESLARALDDPTVEVAHWVPDRGLYVDAEGAVVDLPVADPRRSVTLVERGGRRVGALVHDAALRDDPALVEAVSAAVGLAMENERLHAEVLARLEEVRASRARIVQSADAARRRVERDLHDGAQQRLVSVSLALGMARASLGAAPDGALGSLLDQAAGEARLALKELRELAQGIHPAVLTEAGLAAALESLAERSPVPVEVVGVVDGRLPAPIEAAAYFVVSESLVNAVKHAGASAVSVRLGRDDGHLRVEVSDDGAGGARVLPGSGLEGLADRVASLDGRFELVSGPGNGTLVKVELPLGEIPCP